MKVLILAGGLGSRLQEETTVKPKPMVEIGGLPMLWHIMKIYSCYGFNEFVIALGYKGEVIKDYFLNYHQKFCKDLVIGLKSGEVHAQNNYYGEDWTVHLVETGLKTQTGGRIKQAARVIGKETFMLTYGDGVADININDLLAYHKKMGRLATITAVRPPSRFGGLEIQDGLVNCFAEKPQIGEGWINGGFFVLEPEVFDYIDDDSTLWERAPLERLAKENQLAAYMHPGFWQCMDTIRDVNYLQSLWDNQTAPWRLWE